MLVSILALGAIAAPNLDFSYRSGEGLTVFGNGVPIVRGSAFQFYEPGWTKGYYSSTYNSQAVIRRDPDTLEMSFKSTDGRAFGTGTFHRQGNRLHVAYQFNWKGEKPTNVELTAAYIWAPAFQSGVIVSGGESAHPLAPRIFPSKNDLNIRRFGPDASRILLSASIGNLTLNSLGPAFTIFDARGYGQEFANGKDVLWYGLLGTDIQPGIPKKIEFDIAFESASTLGQKQIELAGTVAPSPKVRKEFAPFPLIPKPQASKLDWSHPIEFGAFGKLSEQNEKGGYGQILREGMALRLSGQAKSKVVLPIRFTGLIDPPQGGGFNLVITKKSIEIQGDGLEGSRNGLRTLIRLTQPQNGSYALPIGRIESHPATQWRGVHLFVGPNALEFHKKLWTRVLLPLGFNKVVLQCERTEWDCMPNLRGGINMKREDLAKLCDWYRSVGVEPIPLIQSFGHGEWIFQKGANRDLAFNPDALYAVDPRKPGVKPFFEKLWAEVLQVTKAKTIHFGLDEVDMIGFPENPNLVTDLWKIQVPMLANIAKSHEVQYMLWGDKCLAPGEAPDATNGDTPAEASSRRSAIGTGAFIADWHYKADPNPSAFMPSLLLWEREGFQPIAAAWYQPDNIKGFFDAATAHGFGVLQTTWAGYESSEAQMLLNPKQFSAFILAGDYGWSGRTDSVDQLGYDPAQVFQEMYFGSPRPLQPMDFCSLTVGPSIGNRIIGSTPFSTFKPVALGSAILGPDSSAESISISCRIPAREVRLALTTLFKTSVGEPVADIEVETEKGVVKSTVMYGTDVRATDNPDATFRTASDDGISVVIIKLGAFGGNVKSIRLTRRNTYSGLQVLGITTL